VVAEYPMPCFATRRDRMARAFVELVLSPAGRRAGAAWFQ